MSAKQHDGAELVQLARNLACAHVLVVRIDQVSAAGSAEPCVSVRHGCLGGELQLIPRSEGLVEVWWVAQLDRPVCLGTVLTLDDIVAHMRRCAAASTASAQAA